MFKHRRTTLERIDKFISPLYFKDVNLFGKLYPEIHPIDDLQHINCGLERPPFSDVITNSSTPSKYGVFSKASVGQPFGPTWSTHWFKISFIIPKKWSGKEVHLRWDAGCEALIWSQDGTPLQGLSGGVHERTDYILSTGNEVPKNQVYYIEMACNNAFGAGKDTMISPPDDNKSYTLKTAEITIFDRDVNSLLLSLKCLYDMANELPETNPRSFDALYTGNDIINAVQNIPGVEGIEEGLSLAESFFSKRNGETQHQIVAVGHCHIDCAWLWTYDETIRKCARSWSSTLRLMESYPDFNFACSQAQQFQWVKDKYPKLYAEMKEQVQKNRFIPVGGTWVEMDGNIPSGESFIRQFLYGQNFFHEEFGKTCQEFWLPDTFGYSAQLPQIMKQCGIDRFLTQKISWSLINKFPHHNFFWEGIDGSTVIAHFPPGDSYEMKVEIKEALKQVSNLQDKGRVNQSLMLFGYGDGGGGPIEDMILRQQILQDVDGIPKIKMGRPSEVFEHLESKKDKLCTWKGELYLELHNGTYTSQAAMKELNRKCEFLLRDLEFFVAIIQAESPSEEYLELKRDISNIWKNVLLNQFHDVLPGSSIELVHQDAFKLYQSCIRQLDELKVKVLTFLGGMVSDEDKQSIKTVAFFNTLPWTRRAIVSLTVSSLNDKQKKYLLEKTIQKPVVKTAEEILVPIEIPATGYSSLTSAIIDEIDSVILDVIDNGKEYTLRNKYLSATIDQCGKLVSLKCLENGREAIAPQNYGNHFVIFDDIPLYWDAWDVMDYHLETRKDAATKVFDMHASESGPLRVTLQFRAKIGEKSGLMQRISLDATSKYLRFDTEVEWHESHKFLKVEFPVSVHSQNATYEIQFGHLERPTHYNTSWDWARFEVCGHKWMDLSEFGFGVALLNTSKYGHSTRGKIMSLSLLRSPKSPDENADMGHHSFTYAVMPHRGTFQEAGVINQAYELNSKPIPMEMTGNGAKSWFEISNPSVILDTVKVSEASPEQLILRFYESYGGHCQTLVKSFIRCEKIDQCDALERVVESKDIEIHFVKPNVEFTLTLRPFQIITVRLCLFR